MKTTTLLFVSFATSLTFGACGSEPGEDPGGSTLRIAVAPLTLPGVDDACYDLAVFDGASPTSANLVWSKSDLCSSQFGDGHGSLSYVGPCDASGPGGERMSSVRLVLNDLCTAGDCVLPGPGATSIAADTYDNPCPAPDGCVVARTCVENSDTPVVFNLVVLRDADQGFFDMAVNFSDIFCSAKLDCTNAQGGDIRLLHNAQGEPDTTVVVGFACTSGARQETWLYMSDAVITCYDGAGAVVSTVGVDPSQGPGNMGANGSLLFQTASYRGSEELAPYEKCYWNLAFGVNETALPNRCVLSLRATASDKPLDNDTTPIDTTYPIIDWSVTLNTAPGALSCGKHPVNGVSSQVTTDYTGSSGEHFDHFIACEDPGSAGGNSGRHLCEGQVAGVNELATFTQTDGAVTVSVGNVSSSAYPLPADTDLGGCCWDPCCSE